MEISGIANKLNLHLQKAATQKQDQDKVSKREISESERIKATALLCLGGFLIFWASMEGLGRISSKGCEPSRKAYNDFCFKHSIPGVCPLFAFDVAVDCTIKAVYEKVGSFWLTVGLYLVPALFTIQKVLRKTDSEVGKGKCA